VKIESAGVDTIITLGKDELGVLLDCLIFAVDGAPDHIQEVVEPLIFKLNERADELNRI